METDLIDSLLEDIVEYDLDEDIEKLRNFINIIDSFYGLVSEKLPRIEDKIDETIEETEVLINYFIDNGSSKGEDLETFKIAQVLNNLEGEINKVYSSLLDRGEVSQMLDDFILSSEGDDDAEFSKLLSLIEGLNQALIDLKDLSVNAIIFSIKEKDKGAGFRVISNEINSLSNQVKTKYDSIQDSILILQDWNDSFIGALKGLAKVETEISSISKVETKKSFNNILDSLEFISTILKDFMENIKRAVEPIYTIVTSLQYEDLIRQNLENLIETLIAIQDEKDSFDIENSQLDSRMNLLDFLEQVSSLSSGLMVNILGQFNESIICIREDIDLLNYNLENVREEGNEVTSFFTGNYKDEEVSGSLDMIYKKLIDFIPKLLNKIDDLDKEYGKVIEKKGSFYKNMDLLSLGFEELSGVAGRFKKLELMAKIEFSYISNDNKSFLTQIDQSIGKFVELSEKNNGLYSLLKDKLEMDYDKFVRISIKNKRYIDGSKESIGNVEDRLLMTKKLIKEAIDALNESINSLVSETVSINSQIEDVSLLEDDGSKVTSSLDSFKEKVSKLKEIYLEEAGIGNWEGSNDRLEGLIDKYSSYLGRKTAKEKIVELDIDTGSEGGDLTLF